jgi:thiol:disulfide interchange protein
MSALPLLPSVTMKRISLLLAPLLAVAAFFAFGPSSSAAGFPKGSPSFKTDYKSALKASKASGKPMLVVFSATWCAPCQANKKKVYPSSSVKAYHDKFIWVYLDTDKKENAKVVQMFKVSSIPHIEFVSAGGKSIDKAIGGTTPTKFAKKLGQVLKKVR